MANKPLDNDAKNSVEIKNQAIHGGGQQFADKIINQTNYNIPFKSFAILAIAIIMLILWQWNNIFYYINQSTKTNKTNIKTKVESRFDIKFLEPKFFKMGKKIRAEVALEFFPLTEDNQESATIFTGIITAHDEDKIDLNKDTSQLSCQETPSCIDVKFPIKSDEPIIIRGGDMAKHVAKTTMTSLFDLPRNIKRVRFYAIFYQREAVNGGCDIDNSKPLPKNWDGIPYLAVIAENGTKTNNQCFNAYDIKIINNIKL